MNSDDTNLRVRWYEPKQLQKLANILDVPKLDENIAERLQVAANNFTLFLQLEPGEVPGGRWLPPLAGVKEQRKALRRIRDAANELIAAQQDQRLRGLMTEHKLPLIAEERLSFLSQSAGDAADQLPISGRSRKEARRIFVRELAMIYFEVIEGPPTRSTKPGNEPSSLFSEFAEAAIEVIHPPSTQGLDAVIKEVIAMEDFGA